MKPRGCRINVVLAPGEGAGDISLRELKRITAPIKHRMVPHSLNCFIRVVDSVSIGDFDEFCNADDPQPIVIISPDLIASSASLKASAFAQKLRSKAQKENVPLGLIGVVAADRHPLPALPPEDLDSLVKVGDGFPADVSEALREVAPRLWWRSRPSAVPMEASDRNSEIVVDFVRTKEDFMAALQLRFEVYKLLGYLNLKVLSNTSGLELDAYDPRALHLVASVRSGDTDKREVLGCARLIFPPAMLDDDLLEDLGYTDRVPAWCAEISKDEKSKLFTDILKRGTGIFPLPASSMGVYKELRKKLKQTQKILHTEDCCELSRLIVRPEAQGHHVARRMIEAAVQLASRWMRRRVMLVECREDHRSLYERFSFQMPESDITMPEPAGLLQTTGIAMWRSLVPTDGITLRKPNAHTILSSLNRAPKRNLDLSRKARTVLPLEAWAWDTEIQPDDKTGPTPFELSLHNKGLITEAVGALEDLLTRFGGKQLSICNKNGKCVQITASNTKGRPAAPVVHEIMQLLSLE